MSLINDLKTRREFLKFMGYGSVAMGISSGTGLLAGCAAAGKKEAAMPDPAQLGFTPIRPTSKDDLVLAKGFNSQMLIRWNDPLDTKGNRFGYNNDYLALFPQDDNEALLWVNHESIHPLFVSGWHKSREKTKEQVITEQKAVGGSIVRIRRDTTTGHWKVVLNHPHNRRIIGQTPIPLIVDRPIEGHTTAIGTLANCAGGVTPWGTILTCEENFQDFYGRYDDNRSPRVKVRSFFGWEKHFPYSPEHYGWVVEIEPTTGKAKKLTGLGRFAHECATAVTAADGRCVVYMGDDADNQCVYKFVSEKPGSLEKGELFVADTDKGRWISMDIRKQKVLKDRFNDQTEVLIRARDAAHLLGGTPLNRPEDVAIDPKTGAVLITQTNNKSKKDFHGSILKIDEANGDYLSMKFQASIFLAGGEKSGFSSPDNLAFDKKGNLWLTCDIAGSSLNKDPYKTFGNNGLFYIPMSGELAGGVFQVASAPNDAEFTGPCFSPDGETLFLSVQHPGEMTRSLDKITSHWPDGHAAIPSPAVVTIQGPAMKRLMS